MHQNAETCRFTRRYNLLKAFYHRNFDVTKTATDSEIKSLLFLGLVTELGTLISISETGKKWMSWYEAFN